MVDSPSRERNFGNLHSKQVTHGMEEENHGQFKAEMAEQDLADALPVISTNIDLFL